MRLILSHRNPKTSTYTTETGQPLYKVNKSSKISTGTVTIRKAVGTVHGVWQGDSLKPQPGVKSPSSEKSSLKEENDHSIPDADRRSVDENFEASDDEDEGGPSTGDLPILEGHFAFYAQIEFHTFHSSRFRFNGIDQSVSDYFRKEGWSWFGRGRVFTASDGKEYCWELRIGHLDLVRNDGSRTTVARFREHRPSLGPILKGRQACLEIDDSCQPILDELVMTFIYCHKLRKDRERSQRHGNGGGP